MNGGGDDATRGDVLGSEPRPMPGGKRLGWAVAVVAVVAASSVLWLRDGGSQPGATAARPSASGQASVALGQDVQAACTQAVRALDAVSAESVGTRPPLTGNASVVVERASSVLNDALMAVGAPALGGNAFEVRTLLRSVKVALGDMLNGDVDPFPLAALAELSKELTEKCS